jgi:hypothetical protein
MGWMILSFSVGGFFMGIVDSIRPDGVYYVVCVLFFILSLILIGVSDVLLYTYNQNQIMMEILKKLGYCSRIAKHLKKR